MNKYRAFTLSAILVATGCVSIDHNVGAGRWFNASLPIHLQHTLYQQERAFCAQAADQWVPLPEVKFTVGAIRHINGIPNVSVEGSQIAVTVGAVDQNSVTASLESEVSVWKTVAASSIKGYRESRQERRCMTTLGWASTNDTWNGTPSHLNETISVNRAVMSSVDAGYSHPLLGDTVIALIDMRRSESFEDRAMLYTTEIPIHAPENQSNCVYQLEESLFSKRGLASCDGGASQPIKVSRGSPIAHWIREYF